MPRKLLYYEGHPHANSAEVAPEGRFLPAGVIFGSLRVVEARSQVNRGIKSVGRFPRLGQKLSILGRSSNVGKRRIEI